MVLKLIIKLMAKEIKALRKEIKFLREKNKCQENGLLSGNKNLFEENVKLCNIINAGKAENKRLSDELNDARTIKAHDCPAIREDIRQYIEDEITRMKTDDPGSYQRIEELRWVLSLCEVKNEQ